MDFNSFFFNYLVLQTALHLWQSANDTYLWLAPVLLICISIIIFTCYFVLSESWFEPFWNRYSWTNVIVVAFTVRKGQVGVCGREAERRWTSTYKLLLAWLIFYTLPMSLEPVCLWCKLPWIKTIIFIIVLLIFEHESIWMCVSLTVTTLLFSGLLRHCLTVSLMCFLWPLPFFPNKGITLMSKLKVEQHYSSGLIWQKVSS